MKFKVSFLADSKKCAIFVAVKYRLTTMNRQ